MSDDETRRDDARRDAVGEEIELEYDRAASTAARGICRRRHRPTLQKTFDDIGGWHVAWNPHTPGECDLGWEISSCLLEAKLPPRSHMTNPPIVGMENMVAFAQRVAERFG